MSPSHPIPQVHITIRAIDDPFRRGILLAQFLNLHGAVFNIFETPSGKFGFLAADNTEIVEVVYT